MPEQLKKLRHSMLLPSEENIPAHQLYAYHIIEKIVTESRNLNKTKLATMLPGYLSGYLATISFLKI